MKFRVNVAKTVSVMYSGHATIEAASAEEARAKAAEMLDNFDDDYFGFEESGSEEDNNDAEVMSVEEEEEEPPPYKSIAASLGGWE
jgi:hypothetical protein